jgi:amidase
VSHRPRIQAPTPADVEALAGLEGIELKPGEAAALHATVAALVQAAARAEGRETIRPTRRPGPRDPGGPPQAEDDPLNAFIRCCRVEGADAGPLANRTVAVKDNIAVAGIPMTEGSHFPPFVPTDDAVVVERVLDAGGTIVGTLNMDELGGGATGVMSAFGPARNPIDPTRTAGGSSGGAGAAVGSGAVDMALAVDQGGSGRIPAAFCGLVAIKATHGLVPSFGVGHIDHTIDYVTPVARSVRQAALLLSAIAGDDWRDSQWVRGPIPVDDYLCDAEADLAGIRVGLIEESINGVSLDADVRAGFERATQALAAAGARVETMSLPTWSTGFATYMPFVAHLIANMIRSEGVGYGHLGYIDVERLHAFAVARRTESLNLNPYVKSWLLADRFLHDRHLNVSFGILQNQRLLLRRRVSEALQEFDLLVTPTVPMVAPKLFDHEPSIDELLAHTPADVAYNTAPLNLTGHPAISVPTGRPATGELPTALQIIAPHFSERLALRAAFALESGVGPFD